MKIQIRQNVFETNSSSTHSITICTKDQFYAWKNGELLFKRWDEVFVEYDESLLIDPEDNYYEKDYMTYSDYMNMDYETYSQEYKTPKGDEIVAFGYYGNDY